ncbi:MAG: hypothetical protein FJ272_11700, partial [Planctomycetes bacterium]|nr:hypothetical protein [Planctomycetota bacterium]
GGEFGWGGPVKLRITARAAKERPAVALQTVNDDALASALNEAARQGSVVKLPAGTFHLSRTLRIPAGVTVAGAGRDATVLQFGQAAHRQADALQSEQFTKLGGSGWNLAPASIHTPGDTLEYRLNVPTSGEWTVWLRYATQMAQWGKPGMDGQTALIVDDGEPVPLTALPNTGSFGTFKWSKSASLKLAAGAHRLVWKNLKGGGLSLDAYVFALDPSFQPSDKPFPESSGKIIVLQGEDVVKMQSKEGRLPGGDVPAVWLAGDGASVRDLTILGCPQVNFGIAIRPPRGEVRPYGDSPEKGKWVSGCRVERVRVADVEGKHAENCGVHFLNADHAVVCDNELWARAPLFLAGVRQCDLSRNRLVSVTRFGGNAEAAILGRNSVLRECIIEDNRVACPPGAEAGGPTARRLIWVSTGAGSVDLNWMARNGVEVAQAAGQARFGGVAGTDQNVGEMILFEACQRFMFFGPLAGADAQSVTLPKTVPPTPDDRLGSVKREQLAHDAAGHETPFWPPDVDDGTGEPPIGEYFVTVLKGRGLGQTRRVVGRVGETLRLDQAWRETPEPGALVVVTTAFYRNLIVGNHTADGMTGIQLWISCIENVIAGNTIARQRKPGLFLYSCFTTAASSMPRTWNRGVGPLYFNHVEGTRTDECSAGALVTSGDDPKLAIEFPRALGNVLRRNSFIKSRTDGVILTSRKRAEGELSAASILGTLVEFNVVRDAPIAYRAASNVDGTLFRRNHAYFWHPVSLNAEPPVAFQLDDPKATAALELNSVEGKTGTGTKEITEVQRGTK